MASAPSKTKSKLFESFPNLSLIVNLESFSVSITVFSQIVPKYSRHSSPISKPNLRNCTGRLEPCQLSMKSKKLLRKLHFSLIRSPRLFHVLTDHKPLTFSLSSHSDQYSPRQIRHLDFISQFTSDIRYVKGTQNVLADALSRVEANALQQDISPLVRDGSSST